MADRTFEHTLEALRGVQRDALIGKRKHFNAADRLTRSNSIMGLTATLINLIVGSLLFTLLAKELPVWSKWAGAVLSLTAAACSSVQTYFGWGKKIEGHRKVAAAFNVLVGQGEMVLAFFQDGALAPEKLPAKLEEIKAEYDTIVMEAQAFPTSEADFRKALEGLPTPPPLQKAG